MSVSTFVLLIVVLIPCCICRDWYVSSSSGSDTSDGQTSSTPISSLASPSRLNGGLSLSAGDRVFLKRGDTFFDWLGVYVDSVSILPYGKPFYKNAVSLAKDP